MKLPKLYKKTSTGAIQQWEIRVDVMPLSPKACITICYGQINGKIQETSDIITEGKNVGKKNETTTLQQAEAEAIAKWQKQKKKGYVERIDDAEADAVDALITGGIEPMLAHKFADHAHKIKYPCYVQPKLDGIRCIAIVKDGACTLWSRTRKPIKSMPHIVQELEAAFENKDIVLDGELFNMEFNDNFEHIVHLVRQESPDPQHIDVQYHVYDIVDSNKFEDRVRTLVDIFGAYEFYSIRPVETTNINSENLIMEYFDKYRAMGYEGAMLRNSDSKYVNKRSNDLQKVKEFQDDEFEIVDIEEGRGKLTGHVGAFVCKTIDGKIFKAKMSGETEYLKNYFENQDLWKGMKLTVKYQGLTSYGIPRFPVGKAIRNYE